MKLQNKISHLFLAGSDLQNREKEVLEDASRRLGFIPKKLLDRSSWWTSKEIGAFRYEGKYKGKRAVLKIQGVKANTSEIYMIQAFSKANKSKILRPPILYSFLLWDEKMRYEALVLEFVGGKRIVKSPTNAKELEDFFELRAEYKKNCVTSPWIERMAESLSEEVKNNFTKWKEASFKLYPKHLLREKDDGKLIDEAVDLLVKNYQGIESEFQHGHLSASDLLRVRENEVVILSNLYWSWKPPFYDAIFGYHWFIYNLAKLPNTTPDVIEQQRDLWYTEINKLAKSNEDKKFLNLAFLERVAAGLNLDVLSVDQKFPIAKYLIGQTRWNLKDLMEKCREQDSNPHNRFFRAAP